MRVRCTVAYDGGGFAGFAANPGVTTVAGSLAATFERILRRPVQLTGAGRTDAGVHAWGQVVSFDAPAGTDLAALARSANKLLAPAVVVRSAEVAPPGFDARHSATARAYRYTIVNRPVADPFRWRTSWHVADPIDLAQAQLACDPLIGAHDFSSFCRRPKAPAGVPAPSMVREVLSARWRDLGDGVVRFDIEATSFCHQMVRSIVGLLVDVGIGKRRAGEVAGILRASSRAAAGPVAPPQGLCLWEVRY